MWLMSRLFAKERHLSDVMMRKRSDGSRIEGVVQLAAPGGRSLAMTAVYRGGGMLEVMRRYL
jgi:hypothetical protein